jgi:hypothetical protein
MATPNDTQRDWQDRYYHIDQILDKPGPRTDESFLAGEEVSAHLARRVESSRSQRKIRSNRFLEIHAKFLSLARGVSVAKYLPT